MNYWLEKNWSLIIILLLSLTPLLWFDTGYLITGSDIDFSPFPQERFIHRLQLWDGKVLGGIDRSNNVASLPYIGVSALFEWLGFDIFINQQITFIVFFGAVGLSMYFLMSVIFHSNSNLYAKNSALAASSLLYMFNFYNMFVWVRLQTSLFNLFLIPMYLGLIIAVNKGIIRLKTAMCLVFLLAIITSPGGIQPPLVYIFFLFLLGFLIFSIFLKKSTFNVLDFFGTMKAWIFIGISYFLGSLFWLLPLASYVISSGYGDSNIGIEVHDVYGLLNWVSTPLSIDNVLRFFGDIIWFDGFRGQPYFPDFDVYLKSAPLVILSFAIPLVVFSSLIFLRRSQYWFYVIFFTLSALFAIFLSKGIHSPFGVVYFWMIDNLPLFWIQRAPWQKFGLITSLSYATLFGFAIYYFSSKFKIIISNNLSLNNPIKQFFLCLPVVSLVLFLFFYHFIFSFGHMFSNGFGEKGYHETNNFGMHNKFPEYLYSSRDFINSQNQDFKLFLLPDDKNALFDWGYGASTPISQLFFNKGVIYKQYGEGYAKPNSIDAMQKLAVSTLYNGSEGFARILGLLNVKYVLQRNDFRYDFFGDSDSPKIIKRRLLEQDGLKLTKSFGKWDFYELNDKYFNPIIYIPNKIVYSTNFSFLEFINNIEYEDGNILSSYNPSIISRNFLDIDSLMNKLDNFDHEGVQIDFNKISNTKYRVIAKGVQGVFPLVLSNNFDNHWNAYIVPVSEPREINELIDKVSSNSFALNGFINNKITETWFAKTYEDSTSTDVLRLPSQNHLQINEYANSWILDTSEICNQTNNCYKNEDGTYDVEIVLEFWPQRLFYVGILIGAIGALISIFYLSFVFFRSYSNRKMI